MTFSFEVEPVVFLGAVFFVYLVGRGHERATTVTTKQILAYWNLRGKRT